jgi:hypothetical protein
MTLGIALCICLSVIQAEVIFYHVCMAWVRGVLRDGKQFQKTTAWLLQICGISLTCHYKIFWDSAVSWLIMVIDCILLGCYTNPIHVPSLPEQESIDLFLVWYARHHYTHWAVVWKHALLCVTDVGTQGKGALRKLKLQHRWRLAQHNHVHLWVCFMEREAHRGIFQPPVPILAFEAHFSWEYIIALSVLVTQWMLTLQNSSFVVMWCTCSS